MDFSDWSSRGERRGFTLFASGDTYALRGSASALPQGSPQETEVLGLDWPEKADFSPASVVYGE